jgi:DNA-binding MarR family transcriptional regulator
VAARVNAVTAWESLFRAQVSVMRALTRDFPSHELSFNEYDVLFNIAREPGREIRLRDLTRHVLLSQPSVSRLVDRLVARGLVFKCPEASDGRGSIVRITESGFDLFRRVAVEHMASINSIVGTRLDPRELAQLAELCDKLRDES